MITGPLVNAAVDSQNFTALLVEAVREVFGLLEAVRRR